MNIINHKFQLGERVQFTKNYESYYGQKGIIISLMVKGEAFYAADYTIALEDKRDYQNPHKWKKAQACEENLSRIKRVRAFCFKKYGGEYLWFDTEDKVAMGNMLRVPELDFDKDIALENNL